MPFYIYLIFSKLLKQNIMQKQTEYSKRVRELEEQGLTTSDAQSIADLEHLDDSTEVK